MSKESLLCKRPNFNVYRKVNNSNNVKEIFRVGPEDLDLFFNKINREKPLNKGECRKSLNLLWDCGYISGLLRMMDTHGHFGISGTE